MPTLPAEMPSIPGALKPFIDAMIAGFQKELDAARQQIEQLTAALKGIRRTIPGDDPQQIYLPFAQPPAIGPEAPKPAEIWSHSDVPKKGHGRRALPDDVLTQREELHPSREALCCAGCGGALKKIGEEVTTEIEYRPASCWRHEIARIKYACAQCQENVVIAELPERPILKGLPSTNLLSGIVDGKYGDHQPLTRQQRKFRSQGLDLALSTMCDWVGEVEAMYKPVWNAMKREALCSGVLNSDDTPVPVLDPPSRHTKSGRLWVHIGGGHVVFDYTPDKSAQWLAQFLAGFKGYFQGDSSSVNLSIAQDGVVHAGCWAHALRRFRAALETSPQTAADGRAFIRELYAVEGEAREKNVADRAAFRQERCSEVLDRFRTWLEFHERLTLPKSPVGEAIRYTLSQWNSLRRYLEDGRLSIDNNIAERNLRAVALGRKNWMFAGSDEGGRRAAAMYSLVQSCRLQGLDSYAYLRDTMPLLSTHTAAGLTPKAWAERRRNKGETKEQTHRENTLS